MKMKKKFEQCGPIIDGKLCSRILGKMCLKKGGKSGWRGGGLGRMARSKSSSHQPLIPMFAIVIHTNNACVAMCCAQTAKKE
jgi:hypothetical protein